MNGRIRDLRLIIGGGSLVCLVGLLGWILLNDVELTSQLVAHGVEGKLVPVDLASVDTPIKGRWTYYYSAAIDGVACSIAVKGRLELNQSYAIVYLPAILEQIQASSYRQRFDAFRFGRKNFNWWQLLLGEDYGKKQLIYSAVFGVILFSLACYFIKVKR